MKRISIASRLGVVTAALVGVLALTQPVPALARGGGGHGGAGHAGGFHGGGGHGGGFHGGGFHGGHGGFRGAHFGGWHGGYRHRGGYAGWGWGGCYYPYVNPYVCGAAW
jgi:hypothetical protein